VLPADDPRRPVIRVPTSPSPATGRHSYLWSDPQCQRLPRLQTHHLRRHLAAVPELKSPPRFILRDQDLGLSPWRHRIRHPRTALVRQQQTPLELL